MASAARKPRAEAPPPPAPIIIKKIIVDGHGGHHGGAWKVAYADFVTAMMAFFLLLWILGATTEKQRKGIADYFSPTLVELREKSAGSNGMFGGDSIMAKDNYPHRAAQMGSKGITIPRDTTGGEKEGAAARRKTDQARFTTLRKALEERLKATPQLRRLSRSVRFTDTREGLRIDLIDQADFAMFGMGTDALLPDAAALMAQVAQVIAAVPNDVIVRGHTDALPYAGGRSVNNWTLSSGRAEATRRALKLGGIAESRFARIEGVADREPFVPADRYDPRNRRMSVTLGWTGGDGSAPPAQLADAAPEPAMAGPGAHGAAGR